MRSLSLDPFESPDRAPLRPAYKQEKDPPWFPGVRDKLLQFSRSIPYVVLRTRLHNPFINHFLSELKLKFSFAILPYTKAQIINCLLHFRQKRKFFILE